MAEPQAPAAPEAPAPPPVTGVEAEAKIVDALKDTFVGRIMQDRLDAKAKEAEEPEPQAPEPKVKATPTPSKKAERQKPVSKETESDDEKKPDKKEEPKPEGAEVEAKPEKPKKKSKPQEDIAEIAGKAAATALEEQRRNDQRVRAEHARREQVKQAEIADRSLPESVRKMGPAYEELHRANPDKYPPDLKDRMANFMAAELRRADEWEAANEGEAYDSEAEEHKSWYDMNMPVIDQDDLMEARISIKARDMIEKEVKPRQAEVEQKLRTKELEPVLQQAANSLGVDILKSIVPEFDGVINEEAMKKLGEENPIALQSAMATDRYFARVVYDAGQLWSGAPFDGQNQSHQSAKQILSEFESALSRVPPNETIRDDGTRWAPMSTYIQMSPAQQRLHYTTEYQHLVDYVRNHVAPTAAKQLYENEVKKGEKYVEMMAGKMGYQKNGTGKSTPGESRPNIVQRAVQASPAMSAGSPSGNNGSGNGEGSKTMKDEFFSRLGVT